MDSSQGDENDSLDYENLEETSDYEGELGDGENSEEGTVVADEDEGEENVDDHGFGDVKQMNDSDMYYDDENDGQPMKEITFRIDTGGENGDHEHSSNKRGHGEANDESIVDPEKKRRKI